VPRHGAESEKAFAYADLDQERAAAARAEERRILHVALTRAERRLVLSAVVRIRSNGELESDRPSTWIAQGVLGTTTPPGELLAAGELLVGPDAEAPVRVAVRWLDGRHVAGALPPRRQVPVDPASMTASGGSAASDPLAALAPVLEAVDPAARQAPGPPVAHLSYSSLTRYERCGLRFHLERIAGLRERDRPLAGRAAEGGLDARVRGSIVHRVLELHDVRGPGPTAEDIGAAAQEFEATITPAEADTLAAYVSTALATPLMQRVRDAPHARKEATFTIPLVPGDPGVPVLLGVVDLVAHEDAGTTLVVDYKTDRVEETADLEAIVAATYGVQRGIYGLAALSAGAVRVDVAHLYLDRPGEPALITYDQSDADALRADLRARATGILARDFAPTGAPDRRICAGCPGRGGLCPVPVELTRRPPPGSEEPDAVPAGALEPVAAPRPRPPRARPDGQTTLF